MRSNKGYSLIELLGSLVIIGLILLVVIPAVSRLLTSNDTKEYNNYLKIIETGAKSYADKNKDDLGGSKDTGCLEVSIEDLIKEKYIKKFEDKNITCTGKVRINNIKGKRKTSTNITCVDEKNKETFKKENIKSEACIAFIPQEIEMLKTQIIKNGLGSKGSISIVDNNNYIKGSDPNNYVWYSGKLWRVVYYNDKYIKLISNDIVTVMNRGNVNYFDSYVDDWLKNVFFPTLKNYDGYLIDTEWDVSPTIVPDAKPDGSLLDTSKIGLLNSYEAYHMGTYIKSNIEWMLSNYFENRFRLITDSGSGYFLGSSQYNDYYGIRPAITMKADTFVVMGNGSKTSPYILEGNSTNIPKGTLINSRVSGEYLKLNEELYRVVNINNNLTKVIMVGNLPEKEYDTDSESYNFSYSTLYNYLQNDWYNSLGEDKELIFENGSWCHKLVNGGLNLNNVCIGDSFTSPIGLPSLGDIYTVNSNNSSSAFWTIDVYSTADDDVRMNVISNTNGNKSITDKAYVKPVMYLKENVIIDSGKGTKDEPFVLKLK